MSQFYAGNEDRSAGLEDLINAAEPQADAAPRVPLSPAAAAHPSTQVSRLSAALLDLEQEKPTETDLKLARDADSQQRQAHYLEAASRQLVAGLTLTQPQPTMMPLERGEFAMEQGRQSAYQAKRNALLSLEGRGADMAAQRGETERHNRATEAIGAARAPLEAERVQVEKDKVKNQRDAVEGARRRSDAASKDKAAKDAQAKSEKLTASVIPYGSGRFEPDDSVPLSEGIMSKATSKAEAAALAMSAMKRLRASVASALAAPKDLTARGKAMADVGTAATALNVALGQGAMAGNEFDRVKQSIGDLSSKEYVMDVLGRAFGGKADANGLILSRLDQTIGTLDESTKEAMRTYRLTWKPGGSNPVSQTPVRPDASSQVSAAEAWLKANPDSPDAHAVRATIARLRGGGGG